MLRLPFCTFDVRNREDVINKLEELPPEWKKVNVLINNAGLSQGLDPIQSGSYEDWETMIDTNIKGLLFVSKGGIKLDDK